VSWFLAVIRRLEGITYWVIEDPTEIHDFINNEVHKEWEEDVKFEGREPDGDLWLKVLSKYKWQLAVTEIDKVKLNPSIMNLVDHRRGYVFTDELAKRSDELRICIEKYRVVIWPIIIRKEDFTLMDGYCRYTSLKNMGVKRIYAYVGTLIRHF